MYLILGNIVWPNMGSARLVLDGHSLRFNVYNNYAIHWEKSVYIYIYISLDKLFSKRYICNIHELQVVLSCVVWRKYIHVYTLLRWRETHHIILYNIYIHDNVNWKASLYEMNREWSNCPVRSTWTNYSWNRGPNWCTRRVLSCRGMLSLCRTLQ